jgi:hypothetical protein
VTQLSWKAYRYSHTYDILPASSSGAYFASGVLVGSTLKGDGSCLNCGSANAP